MTNRKIQLTTVVDGQTVDVFPNTKSEFVEFADGKTLEDKINKLGDAHGHSNATPDKDGFMSKEDKAKLDNVTNYTHPSTHAATMITEDATHRFVTDAEKTKWNNKADTTMASKTNAGLMSASDKQRIDGLNAEFKTRDDKITKNTEDIKSWNDEMVNKEYQYFNGENITINNSIVSKTTNMTIKGKTLVNIAKSYRRICEKGASVHFQLMYPKLKIGTYTVIINANELTKEGITMYDMVGSVQYPYGLKTGLNIRKINVREEGSTYAIIVGNDNVNGTRFMLESLLILEGDWTNKEIPQYFEGIKSFGQQEDKISILSSNAIKIIGKYVNYANDGLQDDNYQSYVIKCDGVKNIAINLKDEEINRFGVECWKSDNFKNQQDFVGNLNHFTNKFTKQIFSPLEGTKYIKIYLSNNMPIASKKLSIEVFVDSFPNGDYRDDKKDILLQNLGFDEGLRGFNSTVCDELNDIKNVAIKRIEKIVINDINISEIQDRPNAQNTNWFQTDYISNTTIKTGGLNINNKLISVTEGQAWADSNDFECLSITGTSSGARIKGRVNKGVTSEQLKERLKGLIVYYELAEPVETPLSENINLKTFNERTYTTSDNIIKGDLSFTVPMNTAANLENNTTRLNTIEDYVDNNKDNISKISKLEEGAVTSSLNIINLQKEIKNDNDYTHCEGTNICIDNLSKDSRTSNMIIKGQTLQNIKSNISIQASGGTISNDTITVDNNIQRDGGIMIFTPLIKVNTTYTLIYEVVKNNNYRGMFKLDGHQDYPINSKDISTNIGINKVSFTTRNSFVSPYIKISTTSPIIEGSLLELSKNIIILEGDWTNKKSPDYFEGIKSLGELENNKINILSHGKNFVDYTMFTPSSETKIKVNMDNIILEGNRAYANMWVRLNKLNLVEGKTYYAKLNIESILGNNEGYYEIWINGTKTGKKNFVYNGKDEVTLYIFSNANTFPSKNIIKNIIISEKNENDYEPYKYDIKNILIPSPLRSINNIQDILYKNNNKIKIDRFIGKYIVTGNENFVSDLRNNYIYTSFILEDSKAESGWEAICDQFNYIDGLWNKDDIKIQNKEGFDISGKNTLSFQLSITKLETPDTDGVKKYFKNLYDSNNPVIIYYLLANPITEVIENCFDVNLKTYKEKCYINCLNNIQGKISFDIPNNLITQIKENTDSINNNFNLINSLSNKTAILESAQMSTALNVLELQKHTSMLDNGEVNEYKDYIGTFIECNNTLDSRTESMKIYGQTLQNLFSGKIEDLYNNATIRQEENGYVTLLQRQYGDCIHTDTSLYKPNTKYTLIVDIKENTLDVECSLIANDKRTVCVVDNSPKIKARETGITKHTFTTINDFSTTVGNNKWGFYFSYGQNNVQVKGDITLRFILLEGDWTNKEIPAYFEGIKSFGESEQEGDKYKISILSHGKNLINFNEIFSKLSYVSVNRSDKTITAANEAYNDVQFYVYLRKGKTYKFSYKGNIGNTGSIMLGKQKGYVAETKIQDIYNINDSFVFNHDNGIYTFHIVNVRGTISSIQLEEGQKSTTYEPYKENKKDILIKEPLRSIGDIKDIMYEDNGQVKVYRDSGEYTFTGDESFIKVNVYGDVIRFDFTCIDIKPMGYITSNNFIKGIIGTEDLECINVHGNSKFIQFQIKANKLTSPDVNGFKEWLKANPTTVIYELATPITENIDCIDINVNTYKNKTFITTDNQIKGELEFKTQNNFGAIMKNVNRCISKIFNSLNNILNIKGE